VQVVRESGGLIWLHSGCYDGLGLASVKLQREKILGSRPRDWPKLDAFSTSSPEPPKSPCRQGDDEHCHGTLRSSSIIHHQQRERYIFSVSRNSGRAADRQDGALKFQVATLVFAIPTQSPRSPPGPASSLPHSWTLRQSVSVRTPYQTLHCHLLDIHDVVR
jgi:hypothetical protein